MGRGGWRKWDGGLVAAVRMLDVHVFLGEQGASAPRETRRAENAGEQPAEVSERVLSRVVGECHPRSARALHRVAVRGRGVGH